MPDQTPDPEPDRDDTDAGYRETLEEKAYEQEEPEGAGNGGDGGGAGGDDPHGDG